MRIVTISREFGSGGRELGKRLADLLECDYYDKEIITAIAGKDFVIVGRNADVLLSEYHPFRIFVCADMNAKVRRCLDMADKNENLSRKEIERKIRSIDKNRLQTREIIAESKWGDRASYHLVVNTTDWTIKELAPAVKDFTECWFRRKNEHSIIRSL